MGQRSWRSGAPDDRALVAALVRRDRGALDEAFHAYGGAAWSLARRVCPDPGVAEKACRRAFAGLWLHADRLDLHRVTVRSWLLARAHAHVVEARRDGSADHPPQGTGHTGTATGRARGQGPGVLEPEDWPGGVRRAVDQLHPDAREAIAYAYFGGRTVREVAALLGVPEGTVKGRIRLGLDHLHRALGHEGLRP